MDNSPIVLLIQLVLLGAVLFPISTILKKAGYNPWLTLLAIIPLVNLVLFLVFAFTKWPRLQREQAKLAETFD